MKCWIVYKPSDDPRNTVLPTGIVFLNKVKADNYVADHNVNTNDTWIVCEGELDD